MLKTKSVVDMEFEKLQKEVTVLCGHTISHFY